MSRSLAIAALALLWGTVPASAEPFPVTLDNCGTPERLEKPAMRAVANDVNIIESVLSLGVQGQMAGYSGLNIKRLAPALQDRLAGVPQLARQYPSLEILLSAGADLYITGWGFGMRIGGEVTPESLARHGIKVYVIRESCIRVGARTGIAIDDMYEDLLSMARAFGVTERATALIDGYRARVAAVAAAIGPTPRRPRVFLYDDGDAAPLTVGRFAMPTALIEMAGGRNVMDDVASSWTRANWEVVVQRDPEIIVINDYGPVPASAKIAFLEGVPALAGVTAIRTHRYLVFEYAALTPGVRNVDTVEALARAFHPERF